MPFYGTSAPDVRFDSFWRAILTPLSVTYWPSTTGKNSLKKAFYIRGEASFIPQGFSPHDFNNTLTKTDTPGEWSVSIASGFDLRRRFLGR